MEFINSHGRQMPTNWQNWEVDCEQVVIDSYFDIACVFREEVERLFVADMVEVLHEQTRFINHVNDVQHEYGDVESLFERQVITEVLRVLLIPDYFEYSILAQHIKICF